MLRGGSALEVRIDAVEARLDRLLVQRADLRERRPAPRPGDEASDGGVVALKDGFHAAVDAIAHPAVHAKAQRFGA